MLSADHGFSVMSQGLLRRRPMPRAVAVVPVYGSAESFECGYGCCCCAPVCFGDSSARRFSLGFGRFTAVVQRWAAPQHHGF